MATVRTPGFRALALSFTLLGAAALGGCPKKEGGVSKPSHSPTASAPVSGPLSGGGAGLSQVGNCKPIASGLSTDEEKSFFHLAEGSEILPLFLLQHLKQADGNRAFLDNPERFGMLPDEGDAHKLPIGMSRNRPKDVSIFHVDFVGFNCAACHVGQVSVGSCKQRILGAPSRFDIRGFFADFSRAFAPHNNLPGYLRIFKWYLEAIKTEAGTDAQRTATELELADFAEKDANAKTPIGHSFEAVFKKELVATEDAQLTRLKLPPGLQPTGPLGPKLEEDSNLRTFGKLGNAQRKQRLRDTLEEFYNLVQLLKARIGFIGKVTKNSAGQTLPGPGRVDAFVTALNLIYDANIPATSPVSYPRIWGVKDLEWFHWDDNTTSILDRNLGQAIGLGAVITKDASTLEPLKIDQLESYADRFQVPKWPFGGLPTDTAAGRQAFEKACKGCHTPDQNGHMPQQPALALIGTDDRRIFNLLSKQIEGDFPIVTLGKRLGLIKQQAYKAFSIPPDKQKEMERHRPIIFRKADTYSARSLDGVWATAPYLHNNSVPNLAQLIGIEKRPERFSWVTADYDTVRVGLPYKEDLQGDFDASVPNSGNSNAGHLYGIADGPQKLSEQEKRDLLEYLKTL